MFDILISAALIGQVTQWLDQYGSILFYVVVFGLVFAGTGLFIGDRDWYRRIYGRSSRFRVGPPLWSAVFR